MKKLLFAICTVATLASCSKDEVVSYDKGEAIGFSNPFVNKATRAVQEATDPSYSGTGELSEFQVWGTANDVAIYAGNDVTNSNSVWSCTDPVHYWIEGTAYKFAALANATTVDLDGGKFPVNATFNAPAAANTDLIYADPVTATGLASNNPAVNLTFGHLLSKVNFTVNNKSTSATNYSFDIKDITVKGPQTGTVALNTGVWSNLGDATAYNDFDIAVETGETGDEGSQELLLIPGEITISFTVDIKYNGNVVNTKTYGTTTPIEQTIESGKAYNFIIGVSVGEPITFSVGYTNWDYDVNGDDAVNTNDDITVL